MRIALLPEKVVKAPAFQQVTRERGEDNVNVVAVIISLTFKQISEFRTKSEYLLSHKLDSANYPGLSSPIQ